MKNKLVLTILFSLFTGTIFAQDSEEIIYGSQIWFAKQGLNEKMMKSMEEKTKKFNRGEDAVYPIYSKIFEPKNLKIIHVKKHKIRFDAGPANAIFIISVLGFDKLTGLTGTGFAYPKPTNNNINEPIGSR